MTELPDGWRIAALDEVCSVSPRDAALPEDAPFIPMDAVGVGQRYPAYAELRGSRAGARARADDVLFARITPCLENGKVAQLPSDALPSGGSTEFLVIRPGEQVEPVYLYYWCQSPAVRDRAKASMTGTTGRMRLSKADLGSFQIPVPPVADQRRIVDILEDHLSRLDAADGYLTRSEKRLKTLIKTTLLVLIPDVSDYPVHWRAATVADAGRIELGRQRHPDWHNGPNMRPYLRVANVFEDRIDTRDVKTMHWPEKTFERFRLIPGDVLLNEGQTPDLLGRPALYRGKPTDVAFTNSLIRFSANTDVLPEFALLVFRRHMHAKRFRRESRITTNIAHLSVARLKPIEFPIPPIDEQQQIVRSADERFADVAHLRAALQVQAKRSAGLRRALLAAAFSGKLTGHPADQEEIDQRAAGS